MEARATPEPGAGWGRGGGNCSGVGDRGRGTLSPRKGRGSSRWALPEEGWGLEFVGIKLDPSLHSPFSLSHAGPDALGVTQGAAHPAPASTLGARLRKS